MTFFRENPITWPESSLRIRSPVLGLKIWRNGNETVVIDNLSQDIQITFTLTDVYNLSSETTGFVEPNGRSVKCHAFYIEEDDDIVQFKVDRLNSTNEITLYIKYKHKPTVSDFDFSYTVPNMTSCHVKNVTMMSCQSDPFTVSISRQETVLTGKYYVGVAYKEQDEGPGRVRRDCGEGSRVRRSCIQYKTPPPTTPPPAGSEYSMQASVYDPYRDLNYTITQTRYRCRFSTRKTRKWKSTGCKVSLILYLNPYQIYIVLAEEGRSLPPQRLKSQKSYTLSICARDKVHS